MNRTGNSSGHTGGYIAAKAFQSTYWRQISLTTAFGRAVRVFSLGHSHTGQCAVSVPCENMKSRVEYLANLPWWWTYTRTRDSASYGPTQLIEVFRNFRRELKKGEFQVIFPEIFLVSRVREDRKQKKTCTPGVKLMVLFVEDWVAFLWAGKLYKCSGLGLTGIKANFACAEWRGC